MADIGAWNVPAGTKSNLRIRRKDWKAAGGAIEHKNRPEAVYIVLSSWVAPKLSVTKAKSSSTQDPEELAIRTAHDFSEEVKRAMKKVGSCFESKYFDQNSIIWTVDYAWSASLVGKRQFFELEINIDTVNTIDRNDQPSPNPANGKVEMYSYKDLEPHIANAVDKILSLECFNPGKALVSFADKKGAR